MIQIIIFLEILPYRKTVLSDYHDLQINIGQILYIKISIVFNLSTILFHVLQNNNTYSMQNITVNLNSRPLN